MRHNHQTRTRDRWIRQRRNPRLIPKLAPQLLNRTPPQRTRRTRIHTRRILPRLPIVKTQITLRHMPGLRIHLRSTIRTRPLTIPTPHTLRIIHKHRAIITPRHRRRRTHPHTNRILTMITSNRRVIRKHTRSERVPRPLPRTTRVLHHPTPIHPQRQIMLILTRHLTRLTPRTQPLIKHKPITSTNPRQQTTHNNNPLNLQNLNKSRMDGVTFCQWRWMQRCQRVRVSTDVHWMIRIGPFGGLDL